MAQVNDYEITASDARSGAEYREAMNNTLEAIVTQNSGNTAPTVTYPFMRWVDTTNNYIYERSATNTLWIKIGHIEGGAVVYNDHTHSTYPRDNLLINSCGRINQRGYVSGTATTTANQYTLDRWRVVTSGQKLAFSVSGGIKTFTAPAGGVEQVIENINVQGGEYALSYTGTATVQVAQSADNISYSTVTPADGKYSINAGYYVRIRFSGGTFSKPKLERGQTATEWNLRNYSEELENCQRYLPAFFSSSAGYISTGLTGSTTQAAVLFPFAIRPRIAPNGLEVKNVSSFYITTALEFRSLSAITIASATEKACRLSCSPSTPLSTTTNDSIILYSANSDATLLFLGCEL